MIQMKMVLATIQMYFLKIPSDGDGVGDNSDVFPNNSSEWNDNDDDGVGDNSDIFPSNPFEWQDTDGDGVGDLMFSPTDQLNGKTLMEMDLVRMKMHSPSI